MSTVTPASPASGLAGFWSARPLSRVLLFVVSLFMAVSLVSDLAPGLGGQGLTSPGDTVVSMLIAVAVFVLWTRSTYAFAAFIPSLVASYVLDAFNLTTLALPLLLGIVAATTTRLFSFVSLAIGTLWVACIPLVYPDIGAIVWIVLPMILASWGIGFFIGWSLERRAQDRRRIAEANRRAAAAAQEERRSLARDLHDIVAHNLTIISMQARAAKYAGTDASARDAVAVIGDSAGEALIDLRRMLSLLQAEGLVAADQESAQRDLGEGASALDLEYGAVKFGRMLEGLGIETTVETSGLDQDIPQSVETALYRVLQEAITNVAKHSAEGGQCRLEVCARDGRLELAVDNTLPPKGTASRAGWNSSASGLIGMQDRVDAFGGSMTSARDDHWWRVRASVPLHGATA